VRVDVGIGALAGAGERARHLEALGFDGLLSAEVDHDPFLPLALAAEQTSRIELVTAIAVAFARNPMTVASTARDLHDLSGGRFVLGLGSQIRAHVTKRFSMPWSEPAARMREFVLALQAIWACWRDGTPLAFRGEFYRHTLMTPMFVPPPSPHADPLVLLAAVNPGMARVAGEVADGVVCHAFTTERWVREVTLPALEDGLARSGRARADVQVACPVFVVTGVDDDALAASAARTRAQIAFYGSTPAYRSVLELHGWTALGEELHRLSLAGRWADMADAVDDDVLGTFAVVAEPERVADAVVTRYGGVLDRVSLGLPLGALPETTVADLLAAIRAS
jgi:probable F420-dependent oxidoreductase